MIWFVILGFFSLFFGLLFVFSKELLFLMSLVVERPFAAAERKTPYWLEKISKITNRLIFATDEIIIGGRRSIGLILIILAIYFFYTAFFVLPRLTEII